MSEEGRARVVPTCEGYDLWASVYDTDPLLAPEEPEVERALGDVRGLDLPRGRRRARGPRAAKYVGWPMLAVLLLAPSVAAAS